MLKETFSSGLWVFAQSEEKFGGYNRALSVREQLEAAASVPGLKGIEFISPLHVSLRRTRPRSRVGSRRSTWRPCRSTPTCGPSRNGGWAR